MEKISGIWRGQPCNLKCVWGKNAAWEGHAFTNEEFTKLLNDETIEFDAVSKTGRPYRAKGKLEKSSFVGTDGKVHEYVGFKLMFDDVDNEKTDDRYAGVWNGKHIQIKRRWSTHTFSERELADLCAGKTIEFQTLSNRTGELYTCKGKLAEQEYAGRRFIGFKPDFS